MNHEIEKRIVSDALEVQDACNLVAVVGRFAEHLKTMVDQGMDTDEIRGHPACVLFADKIADLVHITDRFQAFSPAWDRCQEIMRRGGEGHADRAEPATRG